MKSLTPLIIGSVISFFATLLPKEQEPNTTATRPAKVYSAWPFDAKEAGRRQTETAAALSVPKAVSLDLGRNVTLKLVLIPAGKFSAVDGRGPFENHKCGFQPTNVLEPNSRPSP